MIQTQPTVPSTEGSQLVVEYSSLPGTEILSRATSNLIKNNYSYCIYKYDIAICVYFRLSLNIASIRVNDYHGTTAVDMIVVVPW